MFVNVGRLESYAKLIAPDRLTEGFSCGAVVGDVRLVALAQLSADVKAQSAGAALRRKERLEKMTPQEFYVVDRNAWHQKLKIAPETMKRKKETLKINILSVASEPDKKYVHVVVRTSQETLTDKIEELFLISFVPNPKNAKAWQIAPEMKDRPVITPLPGTEGAKKDGAAK